MERLLPRIGSASSLGGITAKLGALRPGASEGTQYEIDKAVAPIESKANLKQRLVPQIDAWLDAHIRN